MDAAVVAGIGMGALMKLRTQGIRVYRATPGTVQENMELIRDFRLPQFEEQFGCAGHASGGCAHS